MAPRVVALAGGVGAARLLRGLVDVVDAGDLTIVVNTGDDCEFYGVHVSPDVDIVTYTLAGIVNPELGYGIEGDSFELIERLGALGHETWFRLGDRDFAHCLHRTLRLREGVGLAAVTDELRRHLGVGPRILPMSEDPCPTLVELEGGGRVHFEEYLIRHGSPDAVKGVDLSAAERATAAPGVVAALQAADRILVCPSNPIVSIAPILAVPGIQRELMANRRPTVAISPIIGSRPVKGPADRLLRGTGTEVSALGVAGLYDDWVDAFVLDRVDAALEADIAALGYRTAVTETLMKTREVSAALARTALGLLQEPLDERLGDLDDDRREPGAGS